MEVIRGISDMLLFSFFFAFSFSLLPIRPVWIRLLIMIIIISILKYFFNHFFLLLLVVAAALLLLLLLLICYWRSGNY